MLNKGLFSSDNQKWETPQDFFNKLNDVFEFKIDVCAEDSTAKCKKYFTIKEDGLTQSWQETAWMNPPYGREQKKWILKAKEESELNKITVVCLITARPDTKIWQETIFKYYKAICFVKGRIKFGDGSNSAPFPSALVIFSEKITQEQKNVLENIGYTILK